MAQAHEEQAKMSCLRGQVQGGKGDASRWLHRFNEAYSAKVGMPIFPGSLNVVLESPFNWFQAELQAHRIWFGKEEYGGERDIWLIPCVLPNLQAQKAYLWSTTTAASSREDAHVVEIIAPVGLRSSFGLSDGDWIEIQLPYEPHPTQ